MPISIGGQVYADMGSALLNQPEVTLDPVPDYETYDDSPTLNQRTRDQERMNRERRDTAPGIEVSPEMLERDPLDEVSSQKRNTGNITIRPFGQEWTTDPEDIVNAPATLPAEVPIIDDGFSVLGDIARVLAGDNPTGKSYPRHVIDRAVEALGSSYRGLKDIMDGKVPATSDEGVKTLTDIAGFIGTGGLATAPLRPGLGMFGGRMTRASIEQAEKMEVAGFSPLTIKEMTGLERGTEGFWRKEFSDAYAELNLSKFKTKIGGNAKVANLSDVLKHDELYKTYPELKDSTVFLMNDLKLQGEKVAGYYSSTTNTIFLDSSLAKDKSKTVLLHEIQHAIQRQEGWPLLSASIIPKEELELFREQIIKENPVAKQVALRLEEYIKIYEKDKDPKIARFISSIYKDLIKATDYSVYRRLASEVEAFNVERRANMTPKEIRKSLASSTEDVPRSQQITQDPMSGEFLRGKDFEYLR